MGLPDTDIIPGIDRATLVTVPLDPPPGRSAETSALNPGVAAEPLVGPAKTVLADWVCHVTENIPVEVIGDPDTANSPGIDRATLDIDPT